MNKLILSAWKNEDQIIADFVIKISFVKFKEKKKSNCIHQASTLQKSVRIRWLLSIVPNFDSCFLRHKLDMSNSLLSRLKVSGILEKHHKMLFSICLYYTFLHWSVLWLIFSCVLQAYSEKSQLIFLLNLICLTHFALFILLKARSLKKLFVFMMKSVFNSSYTFSVCLL